jgi:hypothetical protein
MSSKIKFNLDQKSGISSLFECQSGEMKYLGTVMTFLRKHGFWILTIGMILCGLYLSRDWNSRYGKPINGDAKSYYAYLPAIFIYQDPTFSFVKQVETTYYPEDGSQFKDFMNEQPNGRSVNKTFPGLSILYAPFFFIAMLIAWIGGYPVDGYSMPFQVAHAMAHVVYFFLGLRILLAFLRSFRIGDHVSYLLFTAVIFGTNCWYYLVYDHSVGHIHNFFLASVLIWTMSEWVRSRDPKLVGWMGITLVLLVITRPTNGVMLLFLPLIIRIHSLDTRPSLKQFRFLFDASTWPVKRVFPLVVGGVALLSIPFILWKWQTGLWLVYSYKDEGFDFLHPHTWEFLFSYQKGWLLWSPLLIFGLVYSLAYWARRSWMDLLLFVAPLALIIFVLSSWWCWTYGDGFGQRPMIEFIPFILISVAFFLSRIPSYWLGYLLVLPLSLLSLVQGYQVWNSILISGQTTKVDYWSHFLQLRKDLPSVQVDPEWKMVGTFSLNEKTFTDLKNPYSKVVSSDTMSGIKHLVVRLSISGEEGDKNIRAVISSSDGKIYQSFFPGEHLYTESSMMEFYLRVPDEKRAYSLYVWNGDTESTSTIEHLELRCYK